MITAYAITFGGFLLLGGRAADLLGRGGSSSSASSSSRSPRSSAGSRGREGVLIAARAIQGLGAAIISPAALSIITTTFEEGAERNKALGIWGAIGGCGAAVGVLLGGILTKYLGWEWIFFVNVPVGALALLLTPRFVRESRASARRRFDVVGAITVTAGLALLVYAISKAPTTAGDPAGRSAARRRGRAARRVRRHRGRASDPLMPFSDLPDPHGRRRERRRPPARRGRSSPTSSC